MVRGRLDADRRWRDVPTLSAAVEQLAAAELAPEVVLLAQSRPGVDEQTLVDRLLQVAPLARVVAVAGMWCEGELRTGRPLAGITRLYWHELPAWWSQSLARRAAGFAPHWSVVGDQGMVRGGGSHGDQQGVFWTVAVDATDFAVFEALDAALRPCGWPCTWTPRGRGVAGHTVGIWDGGQLDAAEQASLERFCREFAVAPAPVAALVDYPRSEHLEVLRRLGGGGLLGKPYRVASLVDQLAQLAQGVRGAPLERLDSSGRG